jgi:hypothetical protein
MANRINSTLTGPMEGIAEELSTTVLATSLSNIKSALGLSGMVWKRFELSSSQAKFGA